MRLGRAGSKSDRAYAETIRHLEMITPGIELLRTAEGGSGERASDELHEDAGTRMDIVLVTTSRESANNNIEPVVNPSDPTPPKTSLDPCSANFLTSVALTELPVSSTKGRKSFSEAKSAKKGLLIRTTYTMEVRAKESARLAMLGGTIAQHALRTPTEQGGGEQSQKQRWKHRRLESKKERPSKDKKGEAEDKEEGQSEGDETQ
jgi:hypothetical protein